MYAHAPTLQKDVYKEFHVHAYHPDVTEVYSNFTCRSGEKSNIENNDKVVFVGLQYFIFDHLIEEWNKGFFELDKNVAVNRHKRILSAILGYDVDVTYLEKLHELGYLPLRIKALEEGTLVPYQVPCMTMVNTKPGFQWLTNMIETVLSTENWPIQTSATTATAYLRTFKEFALKTGLPLDMVPYQAHDFSFRGCFGRHAAAMSGFGHLASGMLGTDSIAAVLFAEKYYDADVDREIVGTSVDATEHSVTCSWVEEGEVAFLRYLLETVSPKGLLSFVADTWDFWRLITEYLPILKEEILAREGALVIRPDSGDPVKILTGYMSEEYSLVQDGDMSKYICTKTQKPLLECEVKGLVQCLWDIFGGTVTDKGYKLLDEHIGTIYGDSITLARQRQILQRLMDKGFASKIVLGVGSATYQAVTRDSHSSAVKATSIIKNGKRMAIFKDPKTDHKKKSAKGLLKVDRVNGKLIVLTDVSEKEEKEGLLKTVFENGKLIRRTSLSEIRKRISEQI